MPVSERTAILPRLLPLYAVIFAGFVGYSLMITVFTPLLLHPGSALLPPRTATGTRSLILGGLLALYPLGQFFSSPMLGSLSDRVGRRPVLLASLSLTTGCYALIVWSLYARLALASRLGLSVRGARPSQTSCAPRVPLPTRPDRNNGSNTSATSI